MLADSGTSLVAYSFMSGPRLPPSAHSLRRDGDTAPHTASSSQGGNLMPRSSSAWVLTVSVCLWWIRDRSHTDHAREAVTVRPPVCLEAQALQNKHL